ncbi:MAG: hypothetical protein LAT82_04395 [Nanoarchaeota archaeon]|nr:hypothetical protein [Nanoarchaeota archaeon]
MKKRFVLLTQVHTQITSSNLQSQGRLDIVLHSIITSLFISHVFREDTTLEIICMGPPLKPRRISISYHKEQTLSKKNLKKIIEIALNKCKSNKELEVHPGVFIKEIDVDSYIEEEFIKNELKYCCILDGYGEHISNYRNKFKEILIYKRDLEDEIVFFLGDHEGISKKLRKSLKKSTNRISLGDKIYFTSQVCTILHYELDSIVFLNGEEKLNQISSISDDGDE